MSDTGIIIEGDDGPDPLAEAKKLRAQLDNERRLTADERARRMAAEEAASVASTQVKLVQADSVSNAAEAEEAKAVTLRAAYAQAAREGDHDKAAEIAMELGRVGASIQRLQDQKAAMEEQRTRVVTAPPRQQTPQEAMAADLAQRERTSPRSADWLRSHPEFYTDTRFQQKVTGAHNLAVGEGIAPDTDEYFEFVERTIGIRKQEASTMAQDDDPPRRAAPAAAPVSRQSGQSRAIPAEAVETAKWLYPKTKWNPDGGVKPQEYWQGVEDQRRNGKFHNGDPFARRS